MERAPGFGEDIEPGRWVVDTTHDSTPWHVIIEPDPHDKLLAVITAIPMERP